MIFKLSRGNYWEFREQMQMRRNWEIPQAGGTLMCGEGPARHTRRRTFQDPTPSSPAEGRTPPSYTHARYTHLLSPRPRNTA